MGNWRYHAQHSFYWAKKCRVQTTVFATKEKKKMLFRTKFLYVNLVKTVTEIITGGFLKASKAEGHNLPIPSEQINKFFNQQMACRGVCIGVFEGI